MQAFKIKLHSVAAAVLLVSACPAWASYGIYVGRNLTADGSVLLGGTGDEPSSHWLEIVPRRTHAAGETIRVGVEKQANFPGELIEIPQALVTAKYITMNYSDVLGAPGAPHQLAASTSMASRHAISGRLRARSWQP